MRQLSGRPAPAPRRQRGLTLIEFLIGFVITGILVAAGAPYYADYVVNARLREAGNALLIEALYAQSEAVKRNSPAVQVRVEGNTLTTVDTADNTTLRTSMLPEPVAAAASAVVGFRSDGRPAAFPDTTSVDLGIPGKTCSDDLRCPRLISEGTGAVRLCRNTAAGC